MAEQVGQIIGALAAAFVTVGPVLIKLRRDLGRSNGESLRDIVMEIRTAVKGLDARVSVLEERGSDPPVQDG